MVKEEYHYNKVKILSSYYSELTDTLKGKLTHEYIKGTLQIKLQRFFFSKLWKENFP